MVRGRSLPYNSYVFIALQVSSLDDVKTNSQTDSNAAKTIALDHLGVIAARIRTSILKVQQEIRETASRKALKPLDEVIIVLDLILIIIL